MSSWMQFINGKLLKIHDIEKACKDFTDEITVIVQHEQEINAQLREENKQLKDEHYKDKEIQKLQKENEELRKRLVGSFEISSEEQDKINEWKEKHIQKKHKGKFYTGAIGGGFTYQFYPTSIGDTGSIVCSCGEEFCFKEL